MVEEFYNLLKKRERRVEKLNGREKVKLVCSVNNRNGQADTYPKIEKENKK